MKISLTTFESEDLGLSEFLIKWNLPIPRIDETIRLYKTNIPYPWDKYLEEESTRLNNGSFDTEYYTFIVKNVIYNVKNISQDIQADGDCQIEIVIDLQI